MTKSDIEEVDTDPMQWKEIGRGGGDDNNNKNNNNNNNKQFYLDPRF